MDEEEINLVIASFNLLDHVADQPWPGWQVELFGMNITLMSSGIAATILVGLLLAVLIPLSVWRRRAGRTRKHNLVEVIVVFVRDMIAKPALHEQADDFLPFLLTLFVFILALNLSAMVPLASITPVLGLPMIGGGPTSIPTVCAALAATILLTIVSYGLWRAAGRCRENRAWPMWACILLSPLIWMGGLSPQLPGVAGKLMVVPLAVMELVGAIAKCFALMVRLAANMLAGHILLAMLMMFLLQTGAMALRAQVLYFGVSALCVAASVAANVLHLLVAGLQAYVFTFLSAMFLGLYVEPAHH